MFIKKRGQTIQEYVILLALVATAFIAMQAYMKRGVQGRLRDLANQISSKQYEPTDTTSTASIDRTGSSTEGEHLGTYTNQGSDTTTTGYESTTVEE